MGEKITLQALNESKQRYGASVRTGIDAITLKAQGYTGVDIAEKMGVKANYISACISRAQKYLKKDEKFLQMIR
jgi:transcriptional regulator